MLIVFIETYIKTYMYRHQFNGSTIFSFCDIGKGKIYSHSGSNLLYLQNAQRCQEGIPQFLNLGYIHNLKLFRVNLKCSSISVILIVKHPRYTRVKRRVKGHVKPGTRCPVTMDTVHKLLHLLKILIDLTFMNK